MMLSGSIHIKSNEKRMSQHFCTNKLGASAEVLRVARFLLAPMPAGKSRQLSDDFFHSHLAKSSGSIDAKISGECVFNRHIWILDNMISTIQI